MYFFEGASTGTSAIDWLGALPVFLHDAENDAKIYCEALSLAYFQARLRKGIVKLRVELIVTADTGKYRRLVTHVWTD